MKQKSLILMTSVAIIVLITLTLVGAWPWTVTGKATTDSTNSTNLWFGPDRLYEGKSTIITIDGEKYTVNIQYLSKDQVKLKVGDEISPRLTEGNTVSINGLDLKIKKISFANFIFLTNNYVTFMYKKSEGDKKSKCYEENYCHIYEGGDISLIVDEKEYNVKINYLDPDEVKLEINGEITNKLTKGDSQTLKDGSIVIVKTIFVQEYSGGSKFVAFEINPGRSYCSGNACVLYEGDTLTYEGDTFELYFIDHSGVKLIVDGGAKGVTDKLDVGMSQKMIDIYVEITEIFVQDFVGGKKYVEFSVTPVSTSKEVTYAGILEMLNSCKVQGLYEGNSLDVKDGSCSDICNKQKKVCIDAYNFYEANGNFNFYPHDCMDKTILYPKWCRCCSAP